MMMKWSWMLCQQSFQMFKKYISKLDLGMINPKLVKSRYHFKRTRVTTRSSREISENKTTWRNWETDNKVTDIYQSRKGYKVISKVYRPQRIYYPQTEKKLENLPLENYQRRSPKNPKHLQLCWPHNLSSGQNEAHPGHSRRIHTFFLG